MSVSAKDKGSSTAPRRWKNWEGHAVRNGTIYIACDSILYDLRVAASLLEQHNDTLVSSTSSEMAQSFVNDIIRRIEDAASWVQPPPSSSSSQVGLGED